jgi:hypothetical protein
MARWEGGAYCGPMERLPHEAVDATEAEIDRAARAFHDAVLLACYGLQTGADATRAHALLGNVRTTATEFVHRLTRGDRDAAEVREAVRTVVWRALTVGGCTVAALRPIVETLAPLLDAD